MNILFLSGIDFLLKTIITNRYPRKAMHSSLINIEILHMIILVMHAYILQLVVYFLESARWWLKASLVYFPF